MLARAARRPLSRQAHIGSLAKEADISILFVHHFNKGKHPTVEGAIGGQGIVQNMTKAIFVMGQHRSTLGTPVRYLACERINAARPPSLSFELRTRKVPGYEEVPFLEYTGLADVASMDVFEASKIEERKPGTQTNVEAAREWLVTYFKDRAGEPQKVRDVEATANEASRYYSKGTFERARERAGIETLSKAQLQAIMGEDTIGCRATIGHRERHGSDSVTQLPSSPPSSAALCRHFCRQSSSEGAGRTRTVQDVEHPLTSGTLRRRMTR